jgi:hypothetical protein
MKHSWKEIGLFCEFLAQRRRAEYYGSELVLSVEFVACVCTDDHSEINSQVGESS